MKQLSGLVADATADGDELFASTYGSDTMLRCAIALVIVRAGMKMIAFGARILSPAHPARHSYTTAVTTWRDRTRMMPWRGFVPTHPTPITIAQAAWIVVSLVAFNVALYVFDLPHVHLHGLLREYVPQLRWRLASAS